MQRNYRHNANGNGKMCTHTMRNNEPLRRQPFSYGDRQHNHLPTVKLNTCAAQASSITQTHNCNLSSNQIHTIVTNQADTTSTNLLQPRSMCTHTSTLDANSQQHTLVCARLVFIAIAQLGLNIRHSLHIAFYPYQTKQHHHILTVCNPDHSPPATIIAKTCKR